MKFTNPRDMQELVGKVIELIHMEGEDSLSEGDRGTIRLVDDICQIHVDWDNGSTLAIIPSEDKFKLLSKEELEELKNTSIDKY